MINEHQPLLRVCVGLACGMQTSSSWTRENNKNDFKYNAGSELNNTTGWYEMFFRGYDPAIGRMLQVDPLATEFHSYSPYNYTLNNPIGMNDPDGARPIMVAADNDQIAWLMPDGHMELTQNFFAFNQMMNEFIDANMFSGAMGPGTGNYWSDGMGVYDDWTPNGGSATYKAGIAAGMTDFGGKLYHVGSDGSRSLWGEKNGAYGYHERYVTGTGYYDITFGERFVQLGGAQQEKSVTTFEILHSSIYDGGNWDWFLETTRTPWNGGYTWVQRAVILTYDQKGNLTSQLAKQRTFRTYEYGLLQQYEAPIKYTDQSFRPSADILGVIMASININCGGCYTGQTIAEKYFNFILSPGPPLYPNPFDPDPRPQHNNNIVTGPRR